MLQPPPDTPALDVRWVPIEDLEPLDSNPRQGDIEAIKTSLTAFGLRYPIVVRAGAVLAGNHRLMAAIDLGWESIAVVDADDLTDEQAAAFALADNRTSDLATYDLELLSLMLNELDADLQLAAGYDSDDLADIMAGEYPFRPTDIDDMRWDSPGGDEDRPPPDDEDEERDDPRDRSDALLRALDVSIADPTHQVATGDTWNVGPHVLVVGSVLTDHHLWARHLGEDMLFVPYPSPMVPAIAEIPDGTALVLVQPDRYLAGHLLDKWASIHGGHTITKAAP